MKKKEKNSKEQQTEDEMKVRILDSAGSGECKYLRIRLYNALDGDRGEFSREKLLLKNLFTI